jgi:hypothetical protein
MQEVKFNPPHISEAVSVVPPSAAGRRTCWAQWDLKSGTVLEGCNLMSPSTLSFFRYYVRVAENTENAALHRYMRET